MNTSQASHCDPSPGTPPRWGDPSQLCGRLVHYDSERGKTFWQPVGPASQAWSVLGPRINSRAQALARNSTAFSIHMVMIGTSEQDAAPNVVFCVDDGPLQPALRSDDLLNDIISSYQPPIGTDFCHNLPCLLAQDAPSANLPEHDCPASSAVSYPVWATDAQPRIGTRLYVACRDGGPPRMATAGPVFSDGHKLYQITVRHLFFKQETTSPFMTSFQSDLDMDDSDMDDLGCPGPANDPVASGTFRHQELARASPSTSSSSSDTHRPLPFVESDRELGKGKDPEMPRGAIYIGKALPKTVEGVQHDIDCALIEVQASKTVDPNLVSYDPSDNSKKIRVTKPADMTKLLPETPVIIATSAGPVSGTLLTTLAYIKPRFQLHSVALYPVVMDDNMGLELGDCGSLVVQIRGGEAHMLGHILFGHPDTSVAYILPMDTIVARMAEVLDQSISLAPGPCQRENQTLNLRTEFASARYYKNLKLPLMAEKQRRRDRLEKFVVEMKHAHTMKKNRRKELRKARKYSFEELFFWLPPEIRDQVIDCLNFRDAMSLRQVSVRFRAAVSVNGSAISRRFLVSNPLPPLARWLYPNSSPDLAHIHMVGNCHAVAWRLADHIVWWLSERMFLLEKEQHQALKARMKQRLLPSLFLLGRFFNICRDFLKWRISEEIGAPEQGIPLTFPFEKQIMEGCSNELLLQTHDVALVLINFLRCVIRPPSQYGFLERTIRYRRARIDTPSEKELTAVLCYGGLETVTSVLDLATLDKRTTAVRAYCKSSSQSAGQATQAFQSTDGFSGHATPEGPSGISHSGTIATEMRQSLDLRCVLPRLPDLDQIWRPSAEAVLRERNVIQGRRDIKAYEVILKELILEGETRADRLYREGHDLWYALSDK